MARSCYSSTMRFYRDTGGVDVPVRWFFVDDAEPLPFPTVFYSQRWNMGRDYANPPLGEQLDEFGQPWQSGAAPAVSFIPVPLGTADMFDRGVSLPPDPPLPCAVEGVPQAAVL